MGLPPPPGGVCPWRIMRARHRSSTRAPQHTHSFRAGRSDTLGRPSQQLCERAGACPKHPTHPGNQEDTDLLLIGNSLPGQRENPALGHESLAQSSSPQQGTPQAAPDSLVATDPSSCSEPDRQAGCWNSRGGAAWRPGLQLAVASRVVMPALIGPVPSAHLGWIQRWEEAQPRVRLFHTQPKSRVQPWGTRKRREAVGH